MGIPEKNLFTETLADNTLEEARLSIPFMKKLGINHDSVILVTRPFHQRRAWATFTNLYPNIEFINIPAEQDFDFEEEGIDRFIGEIERLDTYALQGNLTKQDIPKKVRDSIQILKNYRKN